MVELHRLEFHHMHILTLCMKSYLTYLLHLGQLHANLSITLFCPMHGGRRKKKPLLDLGLYGQVVKVSFLKVFFFTP